MINENIVLREVREDDAQAITDIYNWYVLNTTVSFETAGLSVREMRERIAGISSCCPYYVCEMDGQVSGYCYVHPWKERAAYRHTYETTVYVHPECRGRGIGHRLMNMLVGECRNRNYHALIACITAENEPSIIFHGKLGFKQASLFKSVGFKFGRWLDVVDMELILDDSL